MAHSTPLSGTPHAASQPSSRLSGGKGFLGSRSPWHLSQFTPGSATIILDHRGRGGSDASPLHVQKPERSILRTDGDQALDCGTASGRHGVEEPGITPLGLTSLGKSLPCFKTSSRGKTQTLSKGSHSRGAVWPPRPSSSFQFLNDSARDVPPQSLTCAIPSAWGLPSLLPQPPSVPSSGLRVFLREASICPDRTPITPTRSHMLS